MAHSGLRGEALVMRLAGFAIAYLLGAAAPAAADESTHVPGPPLSPPLPAYAEPTEPTPRPHGDPRRPPRGRTCFSQAETREKIAQRRLTDPISAMRAGRDEGEALRTRLCRWKADELVYEVFVLRRDGRIVRLYMDAQNGRTMNVADPVEHK